MVLSSPDFKMEELSNLEYEKTLCDMYFKEEKKQTETRNLVAKPETSLCVVECSWLLDHFLRSSFFLEGTCSVQAPSSLGFLLHPRVPSMLLTSFLSIVSASEFLSLGSFLTVFLGVVLAW